MHFGLVFLLEALSLRLCAECMRRAEYADSLFTVNTGTLVREIFYG